MDTSDYLSDLQIRRVDVTTSESQTEVDSDCTIRMFHFHLKARRGRRPTSAIKQSHAACMGKDEIYENIRKTQVISTVQL